MDSQSLRVFVSGTFLDLQDYRTAVREALERMQVQGVTMEVFPESEQEPTELSLSKLAGCNVYLGIIGHRYGSLTPDQRHSITQAEYLYAHKLWRAKKMRLLLYVADDSVGLPKELWEDEDMRKRQEEFRKSLRAHTPRRFRSREELGTFVASGLYRLRDEGLPEGGGPRIFDQEDWPAIEAGFEATDERLQKMERFLAFITESFSSLFHIDPIQPDVHPFIERVNRELGSIIPGVSLDAKDGTLVRTGVHHIILRAATAVTLLKNIPPERLHAVAEEIGRTAAEDLIRNKVQPPEIASPERAVESLIPARAEALVDLWAYWDRTGGWGKLHLASSGAGEGEQLDRLTWQLKVENNFLGRDQTPQLANSLASFWAGYIQGFLNAALPAIREVMRQLPHEKRRRVTLPAYSRVADVIHMHDDSSTEDTFIVTFQEQRLSHALFALTEADDAYKAGKASRPTRTDEANIHFDEVRVKCTFALLSARDDVGNELFEMELRRVDFPQAAREVVERLLSRRLTRVAEQQIAKEVFDSCNLLIQRLSAAVEEV